MALIRLVDAIALLLIIAPVANGYFLWVGVQRYRRDSGKSPILLALLTVLVVIWGVGLFVAVLSVAYFSRPQPGEATLAGVGFGIGLLLLQAVPHFIETQMKRIERGDMQDARDLVRDTKRDIVRDAEHDQAT